MFKGNYDGSVAAAVAAYRGGKAPNILQVFEVDMVEMLGADLLVRARLGGESGVQR